MMKTGAELIADERRRQIEEEGWSQQRDVKEHKRGELAIAAACYALPDGVRKMKENYFGHYPKLWPWQFLWWKPTPNDRIRELVKAGALIAAEIDRLQAKEAQ